MNSCVHDACPAHWGWPAASSSISTRPPPLTSAGGRVQQFSLDWRTGCETDTRSRQIYIKKNNLKTFASADWQAITVFKRVMNLLSLEVVCTITGFEEAVRRGGDGWEHTAAAAAPNSQCARSEQRRGDNTDPRAHWGAAISYLGCFVFAFKSSPRVAFSSPTSDLLIDWNNTDFATRASGLISKLSHDVSGEIPKGQGDSGGIWGSS